MKILLTPDKFKGTMTAPQAAEIESTVFRTEFPDAEIISLPLADGGEGTVVTLTLALHGSFHTAYVQDPLGREVPAVYGLCGETAILEMSAASGLILLAQEERNPMKTSTFGTGQMIRSALDAGAREIVIGIGGSATVDGGVGMAEALGYRFYDANDRLLSGLNGESLIRIARIDASQVDRRLFSCSIRIASDVANPLLGPNGAVAVFAPQKGAEPYMLPLLESGLKNLSDLLIRQGILSPPEQAGDGASGGLGMGLRAFCGASSESGAQLAIKLTGLERHLNCADYLVTGEGCTDSQTENGKLCSEIALLCRKNGIKCILLSGTVKGTPGDSYDKIVSASKPETPFEQIRPCAEEILRKATKKLAKELRADMMNPPK